MPDLVCSVENCAYNSEYLCALNEIHVAGANAEESHSTCCGSFRDGEGSVTNCEHCQSVTRETDICCEAENCAYNDDKICCADSIDVCGCGSHSAKGTECASFRAT